MYYFSFLGLIDCYMRSTHAFMRVYKPHEDKIHICLQCPCYNYYLFIRYYDIGASSFISAFSNLFFQSYSQRILATACPIWKEEKESVSTVIKSLQKTLLPLEKSVYKKGWDARIYYILTKHAEWHHRFIWHTVDHAGKFRPVAQTPFDLKQYPAVSTILLLCFLIHYCSIQFYCNTNRMTVVLRSWRAHL